MEEMELLQQAMEDSWIECECCGERVELDGTCPEGTEGLFLQMRLI